MSKFLRRVASAVGALGLAAAGILVSATPAAASATCPYPYVCFYAGGRPSDAGSYITGKFKAFTSSFQTISGTSSHPSYIQTTRQDDIVYVRWLLPDGTPNLSCFDHTFPYVDILPGTLLATWTVTGVMIVDNPSVCPWPLPPLV